MRTEEDLIQLVKLNKKEIEHLLNLGILKTTEKSCQDYHIGKSDYSTHVIQPWNIWKEYNLNPWDADIVKRVLRIKEEPGKSKEDARIMDYEKIIHICRERIRQLEEDKQAQKPVYEAKGWGIGTISVPKPTITYSLNEKEAEAYAKSQKEHYELHKGIKACGCSIIFTHTRIGLGKTVQCNVCKERTNITDYGTW